MSVEWVGHMPFTSRTLAMARTRPRAVRTFAHRLREGDLVHAGAAVIFEVLGRQTVAGGATGREHEKRTLELWVAYEPHHDREQEEDRRLWLNPMQEVLAFRPGGKW